MIDEADDAWSTVSFETTGSSLPDRTDDPTCNGSPMGSPLGWPLLNLINLYCWEKACQSYHQKHGGEQ